MFALAISSLAITFRRAAQWRDWSRLLLLFLAVLPLLTPAAETAPARRILYINSYEPGYRWSDGIEHGIRDTLSASGQAIELSVEYLDSRRFENRGLRDQQAALMAAKYAAYKHDLILVSDNAAFDFAIRNRALLFPGLPIVFCGYNNFRPEVITGIERITGVNEEIDLTTTIDVALKIHPKTRRLVFITSTGDESSKRIDETARSSIFPKYRDKFELIDLHDASMAEITARLAALGGDALVFIAGQTSDKGQGRALTPIENGRLISAASPLPVYSFWDFHLGTGIVGGALLTGRDQGVAAAEKALQILAGTPAEQIPVTMNSPTSLWFDYAALQKFGITEDRLPPDSHLINQPHGLWEQYRWQIAGGLFLLLLETGLIAALLRLGRARRQAMQALDEERALLERRVGERTSELAASNALLHQEVDERRAAEVRYRKLSASTEAILMASPVAIAVFRANGPCVMANEHCAQLTGGTREQLLKGDFRRNPNWQQTGFLDRCLEALADGQPKKQSLHYLTQFGKKLRADATVLPLQLDDQPHLLIQLYDQSERHRLQEELEQHRQNLEEQVALRTSELSLAKEVAESANRAKSYFLSNMTHEINTPLNAIISFSEIVRNRLEDPALRGKLEKVILSGRKLHQILGEILTLARLEANRLEIVNTDFTQHTLASRIDEAIADSMRSKGLSFSHDLTALPELLHGDLERLLQMLLNYLSNALKFTTRGSVSLVARILEDGDEDILVRFDVTDTGIGVEPDDIRRIFLSFEQADGSSARHYGGNGIGLGVNRLLAPLMGGDVGVESEPGKGSTFWLTTRLGKVPG